MLGAEERRLRRVRQYAASLPRRKPGEERALARLWWEGNAAEDVLTVNQGRSPRFDSAAFTFYYSLMILFGADWRSSQNQERYISEERKGILPHIA